MRAFCLLLVNKSTIYRKQHQSTMHSCKACSTAPSTHSTILGIFLYMEKWFGTSRWGLNPSNTHLALIENPSTPLKLNFFDIALKLNLVTHIDMCVCARVWKMVWNLSLGLNSTNTHLEYNTIMNIKELLSDYH